MTLSLARSLALNAFYLNRHLLYEREDPVPAVPSLSRSLAGVGTVLANFQPDGGLGSQSGTNFNVTSGAVVQWHDDSGNNRHLAHGTAAECPLYDAVNTINGYPVVDMGSAVSGNKRQIFRNNDDIYQNRTGLSVYYVNKINDTGKYLNGIQFTENGSFTNMRLQFQIADGTGRFLDKAEASDTDTLVQTISSSNAYTVGTQNTHAVLTSCPLGKTYHYNNDVLKNTVTFTPRANSDNTTSGWFLFGQNSIGATLLAYPWAHHVYFDGYHTYGQRIAVQNILDNKYARVTAPTLTSVTSMLAYWEARDHVSYTTKDTVGVTTCSELIDLTGNGNNWLQSIKGDQPVFNNADTAMNVQFDVADTQQMYLEPTKLGIIKNKSVVCFTCVFNPITAADGFLLFIANNGSATNYRLAVKLLAAGTVQVFHRVADDGTGGVSATTTATYDVGQFNLLEVVWDGATNDLKIYLNEVLFDGAVGSVTAFPNTDSAAAYLGASGVGANNANVKIRAGYLFGATADRAAVQAYAKGAMF